MPGSSFFRGWGSDWSGAMLNPNKESHMLRLRSAVKSSRTRLHPFRKNHKAAVEQYVGVYYSDDAANKPVYVNMIELAANIYSRQLIARPPLVTVFTENRDLRPAGVKLEKMVNRELKKFEVHAALRRIVSSSLFSLGIAKVGIASDGEVEERGFKIPIDRPYVDSVLLDDWVHDMDVAHYAQASFAGHRYQMSLEEAMEHPDFDDKAKKQLYADELARHNEDGDERIGSISRGGSSYEDNLHQPVDLWEIWLRKENLLVTMCSTSPTPLRIQEWGGPRNGPFHLLYYNEVDGNSFPLSPTMLWRGLHDIINSLFRKMARQAERQKDVGVARKGDGEDAETIRTANDGDLVMVNHPDSVSLMSNGGVNEKNFAMFVQSKDLFSWLAGNLDSLGGLSAQSETLGQDQLLAQNSSQRISGMQDDVNLFVKKVLQDFCFYLWEDPVQSYRVQIEVPGVEQPIDDVFSPEERQGHSYYEHEIDIEPHSMQFQSPAARLQFINQTLNAFAPFLQMMQQQGLALNLVELADAFAKYGNAPEIRRIFQFSEPAAPEPAEMRKPPVTKRTEERINRPGATRPGADATLVNQLMGGNPQDSEKAGIGRGFN